MEDIKKILDTSPCLENLYLKFPCPESVDTSIIHELFEHVSSSPGPPLLEGDVPGFLPNLQSLTIVAYQTSMWAAILRVFSRPHRKLLRLEVKDIHSVAEIDNDTLRTILRLVDEGFNIRILGDHDEDYLEPFKDYSAAGRDKKKSCPFPFSSFISRLFCS